MPRSAASDVGLDVLQMSVSWDARLEWIKQRNKILCIRYLRNCLVLARALIFGKFVRAVEVDHPITFCGKKMD